MLIEIACESEVFGDKKSTVLGCPKKVLLAPPISEHETMDFAKLFYSIGS